jgi:hypothetical protein
MLLDLAVVVLGLAAFSVYLIERETEEEDEDLAWVDREIYRIENGPRSLASESEDMRRERREALERLYAVRRRLVGEA